MIDTSALRARRFPLTSAHVRLVVGIVSLWLLLSAVALAILVLVPVTFAGWHAESVASGSMAPAIARGDVVLTVPPARGSLAPGTVITFERAGRSITHRIVRVEPSGDYVTRGDANGVDDSTPVAAAAITGVVHQVIPYLGMPREWMRERNLGALSLLIAVVLLLSASAADVMAVPFAKSWLPHRRSQDTT